MPEVATLTIRKLDDGVKERLRVRAARAGRSMEEEARAILSAAVGGITGPELLALARDLFGPEHGVELDLPAREPAKPALDFSE
jgi:plasmid stability protein